MFLEIWPNASRKYSNKLRLFTDGIASQITFIWGEHIRINVIIIFIFLISIKILTKIYSLRGIELHLFSDTSIWNTSDIRFKRLFHPYRILVLFHHCLFSNRKPHKKVGSTVISKRANGVVGNWKKTIHKNDKKGLEQNRALRNFRINALMCIRS